MQYCHECFQVLLFLSAQIHFYHKTLFFLTFMKATTFLDLLNFFKYALKLLHHFLHQTLFSYLNYQLFSCQISCGTKSSNILNIMQSFLYFCFVITIVITYFLTYSNNILSKYKKKTINKIYFVNSLRERSCSLL